MAYESNNILDLKREALANQDINVMRKIREYEKFPVTMKVFYIRKEDRIIMDAFGNVIDPDDLPKPKHDPLYDHFVDIELSRKLYNDSSTRQRLPGELFRSIQNAKEIEPVFEGTWIYEVPQKTVFPLAKDFNLYFECANEPELEIDKTQLYLVPGREKVNLYLYWNQFGHKVLSTKQPFEWQRCK